MRKLLDDLQLVELDCFYDIHSQREASKLFTQILSLKLRGYGSAYPYGVLPMDTTDFVCKHFALCRRSSEELIPLMAHRSLSTRRCEIHRLPFPLFGALSSHGDTTLKEHLAAVLEDARRRNVPVLYGSSWTMLPEIRIGDRVLAGELKRIFAAINAFQCAEAMPTELIVLGIKRFKTYEFFREVLGFHELREEARGGSTFVATGYDNVEATILHSRGMSPAVNKSVETYRELWDNRLLFVDSKADKVAA